MRDCTQFDDASSRYAICGNAICALEIREMRQSGESYKCVDLMSVDAPQIDFFSLQL